MIAKLRKDDGFGLIELVIAMAVMNVVVLSLFAAFNAGAFSLQRANRISTAETIADRQMELYRGHLYESIGLHSGLITAAEVTGDGTHTGDTAWAGGAQHASVYCTGSLPECQPVQTSVAGPDNRTYRIDSYVRLVGAGSGPAGGREVKEVTVVVRESGAAKVLARLSSTFDKATGCVSGDTPC